MAVTLQNRALGSGTVKEAMRRQIVALPADAPISKAIRHFIKYKVNALLVTDQDDMPVGVLSKTDVMGAYYADLPIESPIEQIMISPPLFCHADDSLESALEIMRSYGVYRLYVSEGVSGRVAGVLAYPDIVGLLYRYCYTCDQSILKRRKHKLDEDPRTRLTVKDVMSTSVTSFPATSTLAEIMEGLSVYRFGAVLITDADDLPAGVISKTDLILAYQHHVPSHLQCGTLLSSSGVRSCDESEYLEEAIREMILWEIHRLFVHSGDPSRIVGVFSLSDAARTRSGSCHACVSSRIRVEDSN